MDSSYQSGMAANPGGAQATATPITRTFSRFSNVATAGDSAVLPNAGGGLQYTVKNAGANSMNVFAAPTASAPMYGILDQINGNSNATPFALPAGKSVKFFCAQAGQWDALLST